MSARRWSRTLLALIAVGLVSGCAGEAPPVSPDGGKSWDSNKTWDTKKTYDVGRPADQYRWPDTKRPTDIWPHPADSYAGTAFGCTDDADCFGRVCCDTPWGLKLCADTCL